MLIYHPVTLSISIESTCTPIVSVSLGLVLISVVCRGKVSHWMMKTYTHYSLYTRRLHRYMYTAHLHTCICICIYVQDYRYMYLIACVSVPISYVSYLERMWALWRRKLSVCSSSSQDFTSMASSTRSYLGLLSVYKDCLFMLLYPIVISIPVLHYTHIHMYVHNVCIVHVHTCIHTADGYIHVVMHVYLHCGSIYICPCSVLSVHCSVCSMYACKFLYVQCTSTWV